MSRPRSIVHLDADAFFVSVEQAADARLRGKPVAVGGERRGIIASASYEARKMGIYTPMPTARARKLCPRLIVLPGDYDRYELFSRWMFAYAFDFTPEVEVTGIDEGYFDLSGAKKPPGEIASIIQKAIRQKLKLSVSEGLGTSKLISQIASKCRKPAAFIEVPPGDELKFLHPLPNKWLPGIGPRTSLRLDAAGLREIRHIAATPAGQLELLLGNQAASVRDFAHGIDDRPLVVSRAAPKSFGEQETFFTDLTDEDYLEAVLRRMADKLMAKVREEGKCIRTLTVKVRYNDMAEDQRSESLKEPTDLETDIYSRLRPLLRQAWKRRVSLRLVSLKLSGIYDGHRQGELDLGDRPELNSGRRLLARTIDALRRGHGDHAVLRAHDLRLREGPCDTAAELASAGPKAVIYPRRAVYPSRPGPPPVALNVRSWYSFLDSALSPEAIVDLALEHGMESIALTDIGNLHGAPQLARAVKDAAKADRGIVKPIFGAELKIGSSSLLCYVSSSQGYGNLCQLLSGDRDHPEQGLPALHSSGGPGDSDALAESTAARQRLPLPRARLHGLTDGLLAVSDDPSLASLFPGHFYYAVSSARSASRAPDGLPALLAPRIHYARPEDRRHWDIMQSIRTRTLLRQPHPDKRTGGHYHFRTPPELERLAAGRPYLLDHTRELAERCTFIFPEGPPQFPPCTSPDIRSPRSDLHRLVLQGLQKRYGAEAARHTRQAEEELTIIAEVGYEDYFLLVWELLQDCKKAGISWITRGSAADSLVCYCLGISDVCPIHFDLYFKRFLNRDRMALRKLPDIDIDFPHDRKDEVVGMLLRRHGPDHCAMVGGFSTYRARGAVGDVAKVLGMSEHQVRRLTGCLPWSFPGGTHAMWNGTRRTEGADPAASLPDKGEALLALLRERPESADLPLDEEPFRTALLTSAFLDGAPRGPKMHPCGVMLSREPMSSLTPVFASHGRGWPVSHYDMDAVEPMGLIKMDILAQGGLSAIRDTRASLAARGITPDERAIRTWKDDAVWHMIASGGGRAVHHIESPAMTSLCGMVKVHEIHGLIAIVSVIRPGAANENKKLAFTRAYRKPDLAEYPHPCLKECLRSTFGLIVYEEHILQICDLFAGMSAGQADSLRRALVKCQESGIRAGGAAFKRSARRHRLKYRNAEINGVWKLLSSFQGYAFNKAHSTAYGVEAWEAAVLKHYHPADFMAAVLTNGKGFYPPLVYVLECHRLGLPLLRPCVNDPGPGFMVRDGGIRVPVSAIKGLTSRTLTEILGRHGKGTDFPSLADFHEATGASPDELETLIRAGACDSLAPSRTRLFWEAQICRRRQQERETAGLHTWLLPSATDPANTSPAGAATPVLPLAEPQLHERLQAEMELLGYTVSAHPLELYPGIAWDTYCPVDKLQHFHGQTVVLCGLVVVSRVHHQVTGQAMKFLTLADRSGMVESELFGPVYRQFGLATVRYPVLEVTATVEPFENENGHTLRIHHAGRPRMRNTNAGEKPAFA